MARRKQPPIWETWREDRRVSFARSDGGLRVRAPSDDGLWNESGWCLLIGRSEDVTIRRLLHELGYLPRPGDE
jgi:hypothetical protein